MCSAPVDAARAAQYPDTYTQESVGGHASKAVCDSLSNLLIMWNTRAGVEYCPAEYCPVCPPHFTAVSASRSWTEILLTLTETRELCTSNPIR